MSTGRQKDSFVSGVGFTCEQSLSFVFVSDGKCHFHFSS